MSIRVFHRSNGAERLNLRAALERLETAITGGLGDSTLHAGFCRTAICCLTRSSKTTSFFDS